MKLTSMADAHAKGYEMNNDDRCFYSNLLSKLKGHVMSINGRHSFHVQKHKKN